MDKNDSKEPLNASVNDDDEDARLDFEIQLVRKMRLAFASSLHMLEAARDDLVEIGARMDRLQAASELCRESLRAKQAQESTAEDEAPASADPKRASKTSRRA